MMIYVECIGKIVKIFQYEKGCIYMVQHDRRLISKSDL